MLSDRPTVESLLLDDAQHEVTELRAKLAELQGALDSREVIGQATGLIMAAQECSPDEAFLVLVRKSQDTNRKLRDVARDMVNDAAR
jgi:AmiR/NasT family two-component response regulator